MRESSSDCCRRKVAVGVNNRGTLCGWWRGYPAFHVVPGGILIIIIMAASIDVLKKQAKARNKGFLLE
jgi:hypothetical protein